MSSCLSLIFIHIVLQRTLVEQEVYNVHLKHINFSLNIHSLVDRWFQIKFRNIYVTKYGWERCLTHFHKYGENRPQDLTLSRFVEWH